MKHLRETFTDQEFEELQKFKKRTCLNWHGFILTAAHVWEDVWNRAELEEVKTE